MATTEVGGFAGGYMAAGEYQTQQQTGQDQHAAAMQDLAKGKLQIQQTQQLLDAQHAAQLELAHHGSSSGGGKGAGGGEMSGISGQAYKASELSFAAGEVYMKQGLIEQGSEFMEKGAKLAESGAALEKQQAEQSQKMWSHVGSSLETVHTDSPTASQDWDKLRMTFPLMFPEEAKHPEVQKFLKQPYDQKTVELLKRASVSAAEQADQQKTKAEIKHLEAQKRFEDAGVPLRQQEAREHSARATAIEKSGGKPPAAAEVNNAKSLIMADYPEADPKGYQLYASEIAERARTLTTSGMDKDSAYTQAYNEIKDTGKLEHLPAKQSAKEAKAGQTRGELIEDLDDLISQIDEDPSVVGFQGRAGEVAEWGKTMTGLGDQGTPATKFGEGMHALMLRVPKALTGSGKSAKDERALVADIANVRKMMTSSETAKTKLTELRNIFARQQGKTITGKGDKQPSFTDEASISAAIDAKKIKDGDTIIYKGKPMKVQVK